jgi:hypothetical protein
MRRFTRARCYPVAKKHSIHYHYLDSEKFFRFICSVRARRKGDRRKLPITADFAPALQAIGISELEERGYVTAAADPDIFNLIGTLVRNGTSWAIHEKRKGAGEKRPRRVN